MVLNWQVQATEFGQASGSCARGWEDREKQSQIRPQKSTRCWGAELVNSHHQHKEGCTWCYLEAHGKWFMGIEDEHHLWSMASRWWHGEDAHRQGSFRSAGSLPSLSPLNLWAALWAHDNVSQSPRRLGFRSGGLWKLLG
ncbi:uncharacterized protein LOC115896847 [Rhinopithecus roxellana]|uniref:uncharacterized protein LOC115896847 n=1 Tax=Rhinopithecus roxellana TaxID=61622 RepID=UPI0012374093|nr:uncharacterized protein LOC115896847 [Rhinopithecus roxellana]